MADKHQDFPGDGVTETLAEFSELFSGLAEAWPHGYSKHPDREILLAYVANRLLEAPAAGRIGSTFREEYDFQAFLQGRPVRWMRQDLALHILTCPSCTRDVEELRKSRLKIFSWTRSQKGRQPWWHKALGAAAAAAAVTAILLALLWPSPPCRPGGKCWDGYVRSSIDGGVMTVYKPRS